MNLQQRVTLRHSTVRRPRRALPALGAASVLVLAACTSGGGDATTGGRSSGGEFGVQYEKTGTGPMVEPTIPTTPDVPSYFGAISCDGGQQADAEKPLPEGCQRTFDLTARPVIQKIANFPLKTAMVWGYAPAGGPVGSPGPTLISYEGEQVQIKVTNELPDPTTIHVHGLHQPNESDGVAGISQPEPVKAGATFAYPAFVPGHVGSFAYHSHFQTAVQDMRGLVGMWDVLPREQHESVKADVDVNMTLQIWGWESEGSLVQPFGTDPAGKFPIDTINGKTGDAAEGTIEVEKGDRVRIRIYNASQQVHAMHLHGHDELAVSKNGHAIPLQRETTQTVSPGDFYELEFVANNPGNWVFHCHFPHHTANGMKSGFNGAPVGMTRVFHYKDFADVDPRYFSDASSSSSTVG